MSNGLAKRELPKLDDLYGNIELAAKQNDLNKLLNCEPKKEWVKDHPMASGVKYIPIGIVEYLLTSIFIKWRVEVKETKLIANAVQVTVRLHVQDPISGEWDWQDGVGAAPIQTKKGAAATDFTQVLTDSVVKATPSAESYAVKDAAEKFGKIFGKDLNRKEFLSYTNLDGKLDTSNIQASADQLDELRELVMTTDFSNDEKDIFYDKLRDFVSVEEYGKIKYQLLDRQIKPRDKARNGHTMSGKEAANATREAADA